MKRVEEKSKREGRKRRRQRERGGIEFIRQLA